MYINTSKEICEKCNEEFAKIYIQLGEGNIDQIVHIICANDDIRYVFMGEFKEAEAQLEELALKDFEKSPGIWKDYRSFRKTCHWRIVTMKISKMFDTENEKRLLTD